MSLVQLRLLYLQSMGSVMCGRYNDVATVCHAFLPVYLRKGTKNIYHALLRYNITVVHCQISATTVY